MAIDQQQAIDAARRFAVEKSRTWNESVISVKRGEMGGRDCWMVSTVDGPAPGEPDWALPYDGHVTYFISVETGECFGLGGALGQIKHFFQDQ